MEQSRRTAETRTGQPILVLGMHRSGTSALARAMSLLGAYLGEPEELLPAHPKDNPAGYWERGDLMSAHDKCLTTSGFRWDRIAGFDTTHLGTAAITSLTTRLREIIAKLKRNGRPWLVKDPRLCLLLPVWLPIVADAACVVIVRDPREIADSMRESQRGIYTSHFLLALWEKYLRSMLAALRDRPALFVSYARLLADPDAEMKRLHSGLEALGVHGLHPVSAVDLGEFIDPRLRRSVPKSHIQLSAEQADLLAWLDAQCTLLGSVSVAGFPQADDPDEILHEFQNALDETASGRNAALGERERWREHASGGFKRTRRLLSWRTRR
jgi:hypothetical protein